MFGRRAGKYIKTNYLKKSFPRRRESKLNIHFEKGNYRLDPRLHGDDINKIKTEIKKTMWEKVGIVRNKSELLETLKQFKDFQKQLNKIGREGGISRELLEVTNLIEVAVIITKSALARQKSLGAHFIE